MEIDEFRKKKNLLFPLLGGKKTKRSSSRENENDMGKSVEAKKKKITTTVCCNIAYMDGYLSLLSVCLSMSVGKEKKKEKKRNISVDPRARVLFDPDPY